MSSRAMLGRSLIATRLFNLLRCYRRIAKHHAIVKKHKLTHFAAADKVQAEIAARDLLRRAEQGTDWVPEPLYPAGGAAGPLLLYILIRTLGEHPIKKVLELGAGQTTRLLDRWAGKTGGKVVTLEHDKYWADRIADTVNSATTKVLHLPLVETSTARGCVQWYEIPDSNDLFESGFELVIVDGPVGQPRLSRYGVVEHLPDWLANDWAIIWDDLDRPADLESFAALIERLRSMTIEHDHVLLDGDRTIGLIFTPKYAALRFLW